MTTVPEVFPRRPLKLSIPGGSVGKRLGAILGVVFLLGCGVALFNWSVPALITDLAVRETARPVRGRVEHGRCHSKLVFHICDVTLVNETARPAIRRDVTYVFTDFHLGDYSVQVMADPAHPDWVTSDLGIDQLTSRIVTMAVAGLFILALVLVGLRSFFRREARRGAIGKMSGKPMQPVQLTLTGFGGNKSAATWMVKQGDAAPVRWELPAGAAPFVLGPATRILGVTGADGGFAVPLDSALSWIDLTDEERAAIRQAAQA